VSSIITAWTIPSALFVATLGQGAASADESVKPGKWEFTAHAPGSVTTSRTECITSANLLPPNARGPSAPLDANHPCKVDRTEVTGSTVRWSTSCSTADTTVHVDGVVHYRGETLDGEFTVRTTTAGRPPIDRSQEMTGRYLGPC
jgi:hypothetical protein